MRSLAVLFLFAAFLVAARADNNIGQCIMKNCQSQIQNCYADPVCLNAAQCVMRCDPTNLQCAEACAAQAQNDATFTALASCATQCIHSGFVDAFDLVPPAPQTGKCSFLKKAACAAGIAGAIITCGGPEDIPCILAALKALEGCAVCFCESKGCPGLCKHIC